MSKLSKPEDLCCGCFADIGGESVCPHCGYDERSQRGTRHLPPRTLLQDQFLVGKMLGKPGGFGIAYLAFDTRLEVLVAIKEYFPKDLAGREANRKTIIPDSEDDETMFSFGLGKFMEEARLLAKFSHPNIVRVRTFFQENGTAYLVMDYYEGQSLQEYLKKQGGRIPEKLARGLMMPVMDGLREAHGAGVLHRDVKPANIYITNEGIPILLDFGAARMALGERSRSLSVVLTPGFAPFEQYTSKGKQGAWTDVYACGATLYYLVTGEAPPDAPDRIQEDDIVPVDRNASGMSRQFCDAVMGALALRIKDRPQTMKEFQDVLLGEQVEDPAPPPKPKPAEPEPLKPPTKDDVTELKPVEKKKSKLPLALISAIGFIAFVFLFIAKDTYEKSWETTAIVEQLVEDQKRLEAEAKANDKANAIKLENERNDREAADTAKQEAGKKLKEAKEELDKLKDKENNKKLVPVGMVLIPGGCFDMGDTFGDGQNDEKPVHRVCLDDFKMDKYEVSNAKFESFKPGFDKSRSYKYDGVSVSPGDNNPVIKVTWFEARDYCSSLGKRLPTEAEWEYAARSGGKRIRYAWGDSKSSACDNGNVADASAKREWSSWETFSCDDGYKTTSPVGSFSPNSLGLYDMSGNVWEWVSDWYDKDYYKRSPEHNPKGPGSGSIRVLRGGGWNNDAINLRVADRFSNTPTVRYFNFGFRCAQ